MLHHHTIDKLKEMKLSGMAQALEEQQANQLSIEGLSFEERIGLLIDRESSFRQNNRLAKLLKNSKLKYSASFEDIDYKADRQLDRTQLENLSHCHWIKGGHNLMITGATGCGKTWLACAIANKACRLGLSTYYIKITKLYDQLRIAQGDGSFRAQITKLVKFDLLILDDFGLCKPTNIDRNNLLEVVDERYKKSIIITSQLPVDTWHELIGEATLADAIIDRLINNAYLIKLKGESLRKNNNLTQNDRPC